MSELLGQPEYLHVLANPVLTHALPLAAVGLLLALIARGQGAIRLMLLLVLLSAAAVWPTVHYGEEGFDRVKAMTDAPGSDWLLVHRHRVEQSEWVYYVVAVLALAALAAPLKWPRTFLPLATVVLILAVAASAVGAYIAYPAGKIRHREFRHGEPSATELQAARAEPDEP